MTPATTIVEEPLDCDGYTNGHPSHTPKQDTSPDNQGIHIPVTPQNSAVYPEKADNATTAVPTTLDDVTSDTQNEAVPTGAQVPPGLKDLLLNFTISVLKSKPLDLLEHAQTYFTDLRSAALKKVNVGGSSGGGSEYSDDIEQLPDVVSQTKKIALQGRRLSVSVERVDPSKLDAKAAVVPKTPEQSRRLDESISRVEADLFIYSRLSDRQKSDVKAAMFEQRVPRGTDIIVQGTEGDYFYIIESGVYEVLKQAGRGEMFQLVHCYRDSGFFGELALLHGDKRAATVRSVTEGTLWAIDRDSFRNIILSHEFKRIWSYEAFLRDVPLMQMLADEEIWRVADALQPEIHFEGDLIIREGDTDSDSMYFIEEGTVSISCSTRGGATGGGVEDSTEGENEGLPKEVEVKTLSRGAYFGEAALLSREPRLANVRVSSNTVQLCRLDVKAFERLLGPCQSIMSRNMDKYRAERELLGIN